MTVRQSAPGEDTALDTASSGADVRKKPRVFVGSSSEGHPVARALQVELELDHSVEVTIWSQGVFGLSRGTLEDLVGACREFDFAVLVLTADDMSEKRGVRGNSARDNVLFELGLFMGALGRHRTFIVCCHDDHLQLPSDLAGVTLAEFARRSDGLLRGALGAPATLIQEAIRQVTKSKQKRSGLRGGAVDQSRLEPALELVLRALSLEKRPRLSEWVSDRLRMPLVDARHLLDQLAAAQLVREAKDSPDAWELSRTGREYVYQWAIAALVQERPPRRRPPQQVPVWLNSRQGGQQVPAVLANASQDGSGIGLITNRPFATGSVVVVRLVGTDRQRDFEACVVHSFACSANEVYLGLQIANPFARKRLVTCLDIGRWVPTTLMPTGPLPSGAVASGQLASGPFCEMTRVPDEQETQ